MTTFRETHSLVVVICFILIVREYPALMLYTDQFVVLILEQIQPATVCSRLENFAKEFLEESLSMGRKTMF